MVEVLVILDGASEPLRTGEATSLELAVTPALDALARAGSLSRVETVAAGLPAGSESAIPALLRWTPPAPVDRGMLEAAARGVALAPGERAWRVDVLDRDGERAAVDATIRAAARLAAADGHRVHRLAGHRLLLVGPPPPDLCRFGGHMDPQISTARLYLWTEGVVPPRVLDAGTVVVGAAGAAIGAARLLGAATVVPAGATGDVDTDLRAKAHAAGSAIERGAERVVVHVGAPDEAAHRRDRAAKVAALERADRELVAPLAAAVREVGGSLRVCPDHGCDPATGMHDAAPVPCVDWSPTGARDTGARAVTPVAPLARSAGSPPASGRRLTERAVAELPVVALAAREALAA